MNVLQTFIFIFRLPVQLANNLGSIVFGVWVVIVGQWEVVAVGLLAALLFGFVLKYALLLQVLFAGPMPLLARKGKELPAYLLLFLSQAYAAILMAGWCLIVFDSVLSYLGTADHASIPALGWSYTVALGPWTYLVWHETRSSGETPTSFLLTFSACVGYIAMVSIFLLGGALELAYVAFLLLTAIGLSAQFLSSLDGLNALLKGELPDV